MSKYPICYIFWAQLFKKLNLDQNDLDLNIPCFAIQDQTIPYTY